jgi:hypothetical protein
VRATLVPVAPEAQGPEGTSSPSSRGRSSEPLPSAHEARTTRLLRMVAALEEAIIRLEGHGDGNPERTIRRLRLVQGDLLAALHLLEG